MSNIVLPKKVTYTPEDDHSGKVIIEPCYPGYGTTLGNSLRRVLLSSLPGAAVVGVKMKNASHEFTTIDGVKEDVLEIILNLKQLRLKIFEDTEEAITLNLKINGIKKVTAADITKNSQVEIINKDLHLLEITDKSVDIDLEIYVIRGYGYLPIEGREQQEKEVGYIAIDAVFSPIKAIEVDMENVRVGKMTNWEKLIISIKTDGTIDFKDAFKEVAQILVDQFNFLLNSDSDKKESKKAKADKKKEEDETTAVVDKAIVDEAKEEK